MNKEASMSLSERTLRYASLEERIGPVAVSPPRRRVCSDQLLGDSKELVILHDGHEYVLRLTRQNKLILTK